MNFESPKEKLAETPEGRFDQYHQEALQILQTLNDKWPTLREHKEKNPLAFGADDPDLDFIDSLAAPPKLGIQRWFESRMNSLNGVGDDSDARSRMMYRVKEELEDIERRVDSFIEGN